MVPLSRSKAAASRVGQTKKERPMPNFEYLERLEVKEGSTAEYVLDDINPEQPPVLELLPAGAANKAYSRAAMRRNRQFDALLAGKMTPKLIEEIREADVVLFAKHVIRGWKHVVDNDGKPVKFTAENAEAFFRALPTRFFDAIRAFAQNADNYVDGTLPDMVVMSGNSKVG